MLKEGYVITFEPVLISGVYAELIFNLLEEAHELLGIQLAAKLEAALDAGESDDGKVSVEFDLDDKDDMEMYHFLIEFMVLVALDMAEEAAGAGNIAVDELVQVVVDKRDRRKTASGSVDIIASGT